MKRDIKMIEAEELDRLFDEGKEDILQYFDMENATRLGDEQEKISISLPRNTVFSLDREAKRIGITRQAVIESWIDEKLEALSF